MTPALRKKVNASAIGATIKHRGHTYRVEACPGEAHTNAFIDNCLSCAPLWGRVAIEEKEPSNMSNCPFTAIAQTNPDHAFTLANAFATSHDIEQVFACLRFAFRVALHKHDNANLIGYVDGGKYFSPWQDRFSLMFGSEKFDAVNSLAWAYLDSPTQETV